MYVCGLVFTDLGLWRGVSRATEVTSCQSVHFENETLKAGAHLGLGLGLGLVSEALAKARRWLWLVDSVNEPLVIITFLMN